MDARPDKGSLIPVLNGFRAYALLAIVMFHILIFAWPVFDYGRGVWMIFAGHLDIFFLISGFALFLPVARHGDLGGLGGFARRRFARLIPTYWLALTVALILIAATGDAFPGAIEIAVQYTGLQMPARLLDSSLPVGFGVDQPLWMISVVIGLYVLLGLAWRPYLRHPLLGLLLAALITTAWKAAAVPLLGDSPDAEGLTGDWVTHAIVVDQLPAWLFAFALGMSGAWAYVRFAEPRPRPELERIALWAAPLAVVGWVACSYAYSELALEATGGAGAGGVAFRKEALLGLPFTLSRAALIAVVLIGPALWARPFSNRATARVSELSYGIYVIHYVVAIYLGQRLLDLPHDGSLGTVVLWTAVVLPPSILFAYLTTRFVENPAREWAKRSRSDERKARPAHPRSPSTAPEPARGAAH